MFKEKISERDIIIDIFSDRKIFKDRVGEEIEANNFTVGSPSFIRNIIGPMSNKLSSDDFSICKREIMDTVREFKSEEKEKRAGMIKESKRAWEEEDARGSNVEWK